MELYGKLYDNEKAIISLTSWKMRINSVSKTIYSLLQNCPNYHIVLVLSLDEFTNKLKDLPKDLLLFIENKLIEILWVNGNIKSHKKYFYTAQIYNELPIILADDDLTYIDNYAEKLYMEHLKTKDLIIANRCHLIKFQNNTIMPYKKWDYETSINRDKKLFFTSGAGTLFPPHFFDTTKPNLDDINKCITADDVYLNMLRIKYDFEILNINGFKKSYIERIENIKTGLAQFNTQGVNLNDKYIKEFNDIFNLLNKE